MSRNNFYFRFANRLLKGSSHKWSRPVVNISIAGIVLGITTIIISMAISAGYQQTIRNKIVGIGAHVRIANYDNNFSYESVPFSKGNPSLAIIPKNKEVESYYYFATKTAIIKTDNQIEGVVLKGIDTTFEFQYFKQNLVAGHNIELPTSKASSDILLSLATAKKLQLQIGDKVRVYFVQETPMQRQFTISGLFETGLPEFDNLFAFIDLRHIQKTNGWDSTMVGGIEILLSDYDKIDQVGDEINGDIGYQFKAETVKQIYPQLFEWINLLDTNVLVLMIIIVIVCIITLISTFFIIILEQIKTIGILKTLGMKNSSLSKIFLTIGSQILLKGVVIGNMIALVFYFLQYYFHIVKLNTDIYYVGYVPVSLSVIPVILVNVAILVTCFLSLLLPAIYIAKHTDPITAITFD
ncbi:MAG: ABC transporter permease [Bacteroidales bacterium]|jgi:lipoprotein-releasing system permease protein|nr:ABC transporter permease [Bacteroidales bacterium]